MCLIPCRRREKIKDITSDAVIYEGTCLVNRIFFSLPCERGYISKSKAVLPDGRKGDIHETHKRYANNVAAAARQVDYGTQLGIITPSVSHRTPPMRARMGAVRCETDGVMIPSCVP